MNVTTDKSVRVTLDKTKQLTVQAEGVILPEIIQLCLAAIEATCKQTLSRTDDPNLVKSLEEDMYEMINLGASTLLNKLFPHIEMRPDLTVDALMEAENKLLKDDGKVKQYVDAYNESAQSEKDIYEHNLVKTNLAASNMNREQRRKAGIKKSK